MNKLWIVVNIGCIECGVSSNVVGVFDDEENAKNICLELDGQFGWREGGENHFSAFPMGKINEVHEEYREQD